MSLKSFDAVVLGAGSAGSAAALQLATRGLSVALLDARRREKAGARWVDAVPPWMFAAAGIQPPSPPELLEERGRLEIRAWTCERGVTLPHNPLWNVDMRRLVERLQAACLTRGVRLIDEVSAAVPSCDSKGRPLALRLRRNTPDGPRDEELRARLFVDATGLGRALLDQLPALRRHCPPPALEDCCEAAQLVCAVADPSGAVDYFARHGLRAGDSLSWVGVEGGYSTIGVHVEEGLARVGLLAGGDASGRFASGSELLRRFRAEHPWVGEPLFGGSAKIPLRRPYARLAAEGVALLGNSACQVFPAHGSGVGASLVAARMLAESASRFDDPGGSEAMWRYQAAFHRGPGALHTAYDMIRRMSLEIGSEGVQRLGRAGLLTASSLSATLLQEYPKPTPSDALATLRGLAREPGLATRLAPWLARFSGLALLSLRYPERPNLRALARWAKAVGRLADAPSDIAKG